MEIFSALLALCVGNSPVTGEFPSQRPVTRSLDVFFDLRLNTRLSKHSWRQWSKTSSRSLWRHCNVTSWRLSVFRDSKRDCIISDEYFIFYTEVSDTNVTFNNWLDTPVVQSVPFFVQACSVVHLALAKSTVRDITTCYKGQRYLPLSPIEAMLNV